MSAKLIHGALIRYFERNNLKRNKTKLAVGVRQPYVGEFSCAFKLP